MADTLTEKEEPIEPPEITLNIARHVVLSDIPRVTTHLPTRFVSGRISSSDPLPPYESDAYREQSNPVPSYLSRIPEIGRPQWLHDLLDQINNGAIHFPRFRPDEEEEEAHGDNGNDDFEDGDIPIGLENEGRYESHPGAHNQPLLRQWLLGVGLEQLQGFVREQGVDRGNWEESSEHLPVVDYVDALLWVQPESDRQQILHGPVGEAMGDIVVNVLEEYIEEILEDTTDQGA